MDCDYQTAIRQIMPLADSVDDSSAKWLLKRSAITVVA